MKKKPKTPYENITAIVFFVMLAAVSLLNLLWQDRSFSDEENRLLAQFPAFSLKALFLDDSKWTLDFEEYVTDQFPLRPVFVGIKAASERALLKKETGGVYFAKEDALIEHPRTADFKAAKTNVSAVNKFAGDCGVPVTLALIPNAVAVNEGLLPAFAYNGEQAALIRAVYSEAKTPTADVASSLMGEGLFYRTDHHPTARGAYQIYAAIAPSLGITPVPETGFEKTDLTDTFYGTAYAKAGAWWVAPDTITRYRLPEEAYTLTTVDGEAVTVSDTLYDTEKLSSSDEYAVFLGGNAPLQVIRGGGGTGRLLLIKDSFSHCIAPLLASHFEEIHLIDMRYYRGSVKQYAQDNGITQALVMYSVDNFAGEKNLVFLNR